MNKQVTALFFSIICLLSACNGSSGKNTTSTQSNSETSTPSSISLMLLDASGAAQQSFDKSDSITVQASVLDESGNIISGQRVDFSTDLGELSLASKLTDSTGIASITINNEALTLGAGTITGTVNELSISSDYEYLNNTLDEAPLSISIELINNGTATNQFKTNEHAQIQVTLTDSSGAGIGGEIINFSADIGLLATNTDLTNANGQASLTLQGNDDIGAGIIAVSVNSDSSITAQMNYQILPSDTIALDDVRIGHFDENNTFVEGEIKLSIDGNTISAGGTLGLSVELIDADNNHISTPTTVTFSSNCVLNENAKIDETVFSIKGNAGATFEDIDCAGITGTEDIIIASVSSNGITNTASANINISSEQVGSIEFVSSEPSEIVIQGSGGQETSTVTFLLKSALGNPLSQQEVNFSLDSSIGGVALSRTTGVTNSQGLVTTQVSAGTVPTVVRVTAETSLESNGETNTVQTQSNELSINTGLPEQASITIAATNLNPEASTRGNTSTIIAWLADNFNNPVPDGTAVNFTTEGGTIEPSCTTISGRCEVEWTATEPYLTDHRSTILATTSGHETFFDTNGNNIFDDSDGSAINNDAVNSGFGRQVALSSGFVDMPEAWLDSDEDNIKDPEETKFFDSNGDGLYSIADGKFNGPQCSGDNCDDNAKKSTLRKALVLVMSEGNNPKYILSNLSETITYNNETGSINSLPSIADDGSLSLRIRFADSALQPLPNGTSVQVAVEGADLQGDESYTMGNTNQAGYRNIDFTIINSSDNELDTATLIITIDTPNLEAITYITETINLL